MASKRVGSCSDRAEIAAREHWARLGLAKRTAVKLRAHPETESCQAETSEPVVAHHGREVGRCRSRQARPYASTACWRRESGDFSGVLLAATRDWETSIT